MEDEPSTNREAPSSSPALRFEAAWRLSERRPAGWPGRDRGAVGASVWAAAASAAPERGRSARFCGEHKRPVKP